MHCFAPMELEMIFHCFMLQTCCLLRLPFTLPRPPAQYSAYGAKLILPSSMLPMCSLYEALIL